MVFVRVWWRANLSYQVLGLSGGLRPTATMPVTKVSLVACAPPQPYFLLVILQLRQLHS